MELVYLWVEEYKNIKKQGFNFSPKFHCAYDGVTLTIDENDDCIDGFFGDNINVTAIVGKNGSGKSSLLELILDIEHWSTSSKKIFYIVSDGENLILHRLGFDNDIFCSQKIKQNSILRTQEHKNFPKESIGINFKYLSLSPFLHNINTFYSNTGIEFFSIYNYIDNYQNHSFKFDDFFLSMIPKIPTLLENKEVQALFEINGKPDYLLIYIPENFENEFLYEFQKISEISLSGEKKDAFFICKVEIDKIALVVEQIKSSKTKVESKINFLEKEYDKVNKRIERELQNGSDITKQFDYDRLYNIEKSLEVPLHIQKQVCESGIDDLNKIFNIKYYFLNGDSSFFFSSGEMVLLFYIDKLLEIANNEKNITLLIDESELHLHPDWQKKFIHLLCMLLNNETYKRNIIITSHSPFLISDIPKQNIIFLQDGKQVKGTEKKQTFGANIHTLLSDSFFMEEGLMGEFAKQKINEIINFHKRVEKEDSDIGTLATEYTSIRDKFWNIQEVVGDDYLKQVLENYLVEIDKKLLGVDKTKELKIERVEAELKRLKDG